MEPATLSTKYQLVIPREAREQMKLRPGMKFDVFVRGGIIYLIPQRPLKEYRGIARGLEVDFDTIRDEEDRF